MITLNYFFYLAQYQNFLNLYTHQTYAKLYIEINENKIKTSVFFLYAFLFSFVSLSDLI